MLGCESLELVKEKGIVFERLACVAACNRAGVSSRRPRCEQFPSGSTVEEFREEVLAVTRGFNGSNLHADHGCNADGHTNSDNCKGYMTHMIVSYDRKHFNQTGGGHFSPIGAYHAGKDLVLILDTARFKYPPHWLPLEQLWASMIEKDPATGRSRGYIHLWATPEPSSLIFTLSKRCRPRVSSPVDYLFDEHKTFDRKLAMAKSGTCNVMVQHFQIFCEPYKLFVFLISNNPAP